MGVGDLLRRPVHSQENQSGPLGAQGMLQSAHTSSPPFLFKAALAGCCLHKKGQGGQCRAQGQAAAQGSPPLIQAASFILLPALCGEHSSAFKAPPSQHLAGSLLIHWSASQTERSSPDPSGPLPRPGK